MKRIFVECTHTYHSDLNTGIQRVVRNVIKNFPDVAGPEVEIIPFQFFQGGIQQVSFDMSSQVNDEQGGLFQSVYGFLKLFFFNARFIVAKMLPKKSHGFLIGPRHQRGSISYLLNRFFEMIARVYKKQNAIDEVKFRSKDVLLLLDSSWHLDIWDLVKEFKKSGGTVIGVCYDIIPIVHPKFCDDYLVTVFNEWFKKSVTYFDGYIAISDSVKNELKQYLLENFGEDTVCKKRFSYFHLGSNFQPVESTQPSEEMINIFLNSRKVFLTVCSLEPRKNHEQILNAADVLWNQGFDFTILFIGRIGWKIERLLGRIKTHPEYNKRLFLLSKVSDGELVFAYKNSTSLIFASYAEGFGLPIIEALNFGLPVKASDIPVHREVGGLDVKYFKLNDEIHLSNLMKEDIEMDIASEKVIKDRSLSWKDSVSQLFGEIQNIICH